MKRSFLTFSGVIIFAGFIAAQNPQWKISGDKIVTQWAEKVNPANPLDWAADIYINGILQKILLLNRST